MVCLRSSNIIDGITVRLRPSDITVSGNIRNMILPNIWTTVAPGHRGYSVTSRTPGNKMFMPCCSFHHDDAIVMAITYNIFVTFSIV